MKLFYSPGACSIGIHLLLEEIGAPYETQKVDLAGGEQTRPPFSEMNPKGKVPTVQLDDGTVLTEFPVIAQYLAQNGAGPDGLWPREEAAALHAAETMQFCVGTIHPQGFARLFRPANFAGNETEYDGVRAKGREMLGKQFAVVSGALGDKPYIAGDAFSAADAAMFYVEFWASKRFPMELPGNVRAHFERVMARPATERVFQAEGLAS